MFADEPWEAAEAFADRVFPDVEDGESVEIEVFVGGRVSLFDVQVSRRWKAKLRR